MRQPLPFHPLTSMQSAWIAFAQSRWCGATGVERVQTLSDYRDHSFGIATGTRIEELGLLTRAVFLAGHDGKLAYVEYVPEITNHPDYDAALDACVLCQNKYDEFLFSL